MFYKPMYTITGLSVVVQTPAHTFIPYNILVNAPSLGADCFPRVVETPWLHSVTPPPFTIAPQQWLFNKLLVRKETTLFKIQMTRQRESFFSSTPGWVARKGVIHSDYIQSLLSLRISKWGFQRSGISGESDIQLRSDLTTHSADKGAAN